MQDDLLSKFANSGVKRRLPALSAVACIFLAFSSANAYTEEGVAGNTSSWESAEYRRDWGLTSMNASTAYAMGFNGGGVKIGVMDSGVLLSHPEFQDGRIHVVKTVGTYGKDGVRYPDAILTGFGALNKDQPALNGRRNYDATHRGEFRRGEAFNVDGSWERGVNDAHGTHVGGTMAASRDGSGMHGVAFGADLYSANTGGTDNMTYGPNQDYNYFLKGYTALADAGAKVINNSWGSNRRVNSAFSGALGYSPNYAWNMISEYNVEYWDVGSYQETSNPADVLLLKDLNEAKKAYYQFITAGEKSFLDAAYEVAKNKEVIQVFTAGNRSKMAESYTRAMLPYFRPDAEKYWVNVTGQDGGEGYPNNFDEDIYNISTDSEGGSSSDIQKYNQAGNSKWWTIAAPAANIYSSYVEITDMATYGNAIYRSSNGTSMAAPHVSGALGVIIQRYPYMSVSQVREVMLTTARQRTLRTGAGAGGMLERWGGDPEGVPSAVWGWGVLDLGKAMFGPGQFMGNFDVTMAQDDIWSNDISDVAIKFRRGEDANDAAAWAVRKSALEAQASLSAEERAEMTVETAREQARALRAAEGYEGSLTKRGDGTLTLTGANSFTGATNIYGGKISALNQSIGSSASINVHNGGALEILNSVTYQTPSASGYVNTTRNSDATQVTATIKQGGTFIITHESIPGRTSAGASNLNLTFENGSRIGLQDPLMEDINRIYADPTKSKKYWVEGSFSGYNDAIVNEYAFFDLVKNFSDSKLELTLKKGEKSMSDIALNNNQRLIASVIESSSSQPALLTAFRSRPTVLTSDLYRSFMFATPQQAADTLKTFANEANFAAQNASVINNVLLRDTVMNHRRDFNAINKDENATGISFWANTSANAIRFNSDDGSGRLKSTSATQLFGLDGALLDNLRVGLVLGTGKTKTKEGANKEFSNTNRHIGIYAQSDFDAVKFDLGAIYTDIRRKKVGLSTVVQYTSGDTIKSDEKLINTFANLTYSGLNSENLIIDPYIGVSHIYAKVDDTNEQIGIFSMSTDVKNRRMNILTAGIAPSLPFKIGSMNSSAQLDLAYNRFFGDKSPRAGVNIASAGYVELDGKELKDFATVGAGIEVMAFKNTSFRLSYTGFFGNEARSNSVNAKIQISF